jgi:hypothetical protein
LLQPEPASKTVACVSVSMFEIEPATTEQGIAEVNTKWIYTYESYANFPEINSCVQKCSEINSLAFTIILSIFGM